MMQQLEGKVAVVTGASAGIGAAIAKALVESGMTVVGLARRKEKLDQLSESLKGSAGKLLSVKTDITNEEEVEAAFKWIDDTLGGLHVLVNNAGVVALTEIIDGDARKWKSVLDVNIFGLALATREAIKVMRTHDIDGHIINLNSVAGHKVIEVAGFNVYSASKYAVTALTETIRLELHRLESKIKITSISPGLTNTEIFQAAGSTIKTAQDIFQVRRLLETEDIVRAIKYVITNPPYVQVSEITIRPVGEQF